MDGYQLTVLVIAVAVLIMILAYLGIQMKGAGSQAPFPPNASACPDFWTTNADNTCTAGNRNLGSFASGYTFTPNNIRVNGLSSACSLKKWASTNNVIWDGYNNFNQCNTA